MQQRYVASVVTQSQVDEKERRLSRVLVELEKLRKMGKIYPLLRSPPNLYKVNSLVDPWGESKERISLEMLEIDVEEAKKELLDEIK